MSHVTYRQLDEVLASLGFSIRVVTLDSKLRVYEHKQTGAKFWLAYRPDEEPVLPHHLAAVEGALRAHGIAEPVDFVAQTQKAS